MKKCLIFCGFVGLACMALAQTPDGWEPRSQRDEIRPAFSESPNAGRDGKAALTISTDQREGLDGYWAKTFPVEGGTYYRFQAFRKLKNVGLPRRSALVRILWHNDQGKQVPRDEPAATDFLRGMAVTAEAEHPADQKTGPDGWTEVTGVYRAPAKATRAVVELHLQWASNARADWSQIALEKTAAPALRPVRFAAVHFRPVGGKTSADKCRLFEPLLQKAAEQRADLVVLPEVLTYYGMGKKPAECAEPVPGPSTDYFGSLAKKHNFYVVASLYERDGDLVYNTAALIGPDGWLIGKYRKVCLPRDEAAGGVAPGNAYPVFETRFGKVGMMVCYDGFFPEVARQLSNRGAEVIAWPVWGCNPNLASARACENHVYVVSSTYEAPDRNWMLSAIWDYQGRPIARGEKFGEVVVAEVDLGKPMQWPSLGDFKGELPRHRPAWSTGDEDKPQ